MLTAGGAPIIFPLLLLNNTDYTRERFREEQKIVVRNLPVDVSDPELTGDIVVAHATMTEEEWLRGLEFRLLPHLFQKSLLRCTLRLLRRSDGVRRSNSATGSVTSSRRGHGRLDARDRAELPGRLDDPDRLDRELLQGELGLEVGNGDLYGRQEIHYEAILHRLVRDPAVLEHFVDEAVAVLLRSLPQQSQPERGLLRAAKELDLAAGAVFRSVITGTVEKADFRAPTDLLDLLRNAGDLPPDLACPPGGEVTGRISALPAHLEGMQPAHRFSRFVGLVWRGLVSPLREAVVECDTPQATSAVGG